MRTKSYKTNSKEIFHHLPYNDADGKGRLISFINSRVYFSAHLIDECTATEKLSQII